MRPKSLSWIDIAETSNKVEGVIPESHNEACMLDALKRLVVICHFEWLVDYFWDEIHRLRYLPSTRKCVQSLAPNKAEPCLSLMKHQR